MENIKVIKASEMQRIESLAIQEGASALIFMQQAALGIKEEVLRYLEENRVPPEGN